MLAQRKKKRNESALNQESVSGFDENGSNSDVRSEKETER